jgi:heme/copper-type cytochrome/quinol oxidase subunit 2
MLNETVCNVLDPFSLKVSYDALPGSLFPVELIFYSEDIELKRISFEIKTQNTCLTDPLGPDEYGYIILDEADINYHDHPEYNWIDISEIGTNLGIYDINDNADCVGSVNLPFSFRYYGISYNQITISTNGFFVFGITQNPAMRNLPLPGSGAPVNIVAPFWADLVVQDGDQRGIYTYYDQNRHAFIVQWNEVKAFYYPINSFTDPLNFQVIIYDSQYYQGTPYDGIMKFQYKDFQEGFQGTDNYPCNYFTTGIQNQNGMIGLTYAYNNIYNNGCPVLSDNKALLITSIQNIEDQESLFELPLQFLMQEDHEADFNLSQYIQGFSPENSNDYHISFMPSDNVEISMNNFNVSFSPLPDWCGIEPIHFKLYYENEIIAERITYLKVAPINDAPVIYNPIESITFNDNNVYILNALDIFNDSDLLYGGNLTISCLPVDSINIFVQDYSVFLTPATNWIGQGILSISAVDDSLLSVTHNLMINVIDVNEAPVINFPSVINGIEDNVLIIILQNYVSDIDNPFDELEIQSNSSTHLNASIDDDLLIVSPSDNYFGSEYIRISVSDLIDNPQRLTTVDSVLITIAPVNDPPVINQTIPADSVLTINFESTILFSISANDVEGSNLIYYWFVNDVNQNNNNPNLQLTFNDIGVYYVRCRITDGYNYLNYVWTINVTSSNNDVFVKTTSLIGNYPNPFNPETKISYQLHQEGRVIVKIFNSKGQIVKELVNEVQKQGKYLLIWNGENDDGKKVASGIYYVMMKTQGYSKIQKMMLIK